MAETTTSKPNTPVKIENIEQASSNFYWIYESENQAFNLQTTIRGILTFDQIQAHIKAVLEATAHVHSLGGQAKQVGRSAEQPAPAAQSLPLPDAVDTILTEMAQQPFPTQSEADKEPSADTFSTTELVVEIKNGKKFFHVVGDRPYHKYGVTVWDEVLTAAGIPVSKLQGGADGKAARYKLPGYTATVTINDKGYKKVANLEKVAS